MQRSFLLFLFMAMLAVGLTVADAAASSALDLSWQGKVDEAVLLNIEHGDAEFIIFLKDQADLSRSTRFHGKRQKRQHVFASLQAAAETTQEPILRFLRSRKIEFRPYWIANMIWVRGDRETLRLMALRDDVSCIVDNPQVTLQVPAADVENAERTLAAVEWGIEKVQAPAVWLQGVTGAGVVVAGQDTGYQWDHPALIEQYRGWNGVSADHDYNWHDAVHSGGGVCGADSAAPCDDYSHGTHTMGTAVGGDGGANQIGVAPGARWIGCRNMNQGVGTPISYSECFQWFLAPTRIDGSAPNPALAPDIIVNSWSCTAAEGCTNPLILQTVVENVRAAGILTVHSAGNLGPACASVREPAAIYEASFSVGAADSSDQIASFSSRGPVLADGSGRTKPDISAPGVAIRSAVRGSSYAMMSGTSMAAPHVAGLAALLIDANPALAGQVNLLEELIEQSAVHFTTNQGCGSDGLLSVPNNVFGWGRIDALAAYEAALLRAIATTGVFRRDNGLIYLKKENTTGFADASLCYGIAGDIPIAGDWDGDGVDGIGIYRNGSFYLKNTIATGYADMVFAFGQDGDQPVAGDWDGDGIDTIGVYRDGLFLLRNSNDTGPAEMSFLLGIPDDVPLAGNWDGSGGDSCGVFRPSNGLIFLKNENTSGYADVAITFGIENDLPIMGDWNGDGVDTIGVYRNGAFLLRNSNQTGWAEMMFWLGTDGDVPISGRWGLP